MAIKKASIGKFQCGCGLKYSCLSSLSIHIKKMHNDIEPPGTINGPSASKYQKTVQSNDGCG